MPKLHLKPIKQQLQQLYSGLKTEKKQLQMKIKKKNTKYTPQTCNSTFGKNQL